MSRTKKKWNSYVKLGAAMLIGALIGGIIGGGMGFFELDKWDMSFLEETLTRWQIPILLVVFVISAVLGEVVLHKLKMLNRLLEEAEDEEADMLEYTEEKYGSIGVIISNVSMVLTLIFFAVDYSNAHLEQSAGSMIASSLLTVLVFLYQGVWQIRYVKMIQARIPRLQADPGEWSQKKFQKDWLDSCDEAEKELIYQSGYEAYIGVMRIIPILEVVAMISHLMWNTGVFAVVIIGVVWVWTTFLYCKNCVSKRRKKLTS